jgi:hypothetical protein
MIYNFDYSRIPDSLLHEAVIESLVNCDLECNRSGTEYRFHCPLCGGHTKNRNNKCGYVYTDKWKYACYNCNKSFAFTKFLKNEHNEIYKRVIFHAFDNKKREWKKTQKTKAEKTYNANNLYKFKVGELVELTDETNPTAIKALEYCRSRRIRKSVYKKWFVCIRDDKYKDRDINGNYVKNENGKYVGNEYGNRIIIPYYRYGGKWVQFDARSLDEHSLLRYRNLESAERELYNIDFLNVNEPFFLLEGAIDSTFIKNSIAFGGTKHLMKFLEQYPELKKNAHNGTVIWDNDDAGKDEIETTVKMGFSWFEWTHIKPTEEFKYNIDGTLRQIKDINNAVMYSDCFRLDKNGFIVFDDLKNYIRKADGAMIKLMLLHGNREKMKYEKQKQAKKIITKKSKPTTPYF